MTSSQKPRVCGRSKTTASIRTAAVGYMMIHESVWTNFVLDLDFKISPGCKSGIFFRTWPLHASARQDVGYTWPGNRHRRYPNRRVSRHGHIYDLVKPQKNATKPAGTVEPRRRHLTTRIGSRIELNGELVTEMNLDQWSVPNQRPDGTGHKFDIAWKNHRRKGYIGLQDHGARLLVPEHRLKPLSD